MSRRRKNLDQPISVRCPDKQVLQRGGKRGRLTNWRTITVEKEKYQAYLCSREWAEKREAVRNRANGLCERCRALPMAAVHHLPYARKYDESLDDLQAICQPCHDFTHGKDGFDPTWCIGPLTYLIACKADGKKPPMPFELFAGLIEPNGLKSDVGEFVIAARILYAAGLDDAAKHVLTAVPFAVPKAFFLYHTHDPALVDRCYEVTGWKSLDWSELILDPERE